MKIELVLKSPTVSIPVSFSASSPSSGGEAHNGLPSGGSNGDILVKVGKEEYESEWKPVDEALGDFPKQVQDALYEQSKILSQMNESVGVKSSVTVDGKVVLEFPADTYIAEAIAALVNSAPATLDTLAEIAKALGDDPNFATTIFAEIGKKADATATAQAIAGKSAVKVGGEVVSEFDADTKMDRPNNTTGAIKVIAVNWNNTIGLQGLGSTPQADRIAMFTSRKTLQTEVATDGKDAVNLSQMNTALSDKASAKSVETLIKKVENLEAGIAPDAFVVDDSTAYVKTIPADAAPYAELRSVGGMTHKVEQSTPVPINTDVVDDYDLGFVDVSADGYIWVSNYMYSGWGVSFGEFFPTAIIGKKYKFTAKSGGEGDLTQANVTTSVPLDSAFTLAEEHLSSSVWFNIGYDDDGAAGQPVGGTYTLTLVEVTDALVYTPVTALDIKDASGNVTNTFAIPAAVQALDGYGWGIPNGAHNGVEWDEDGRPTFVKRVGKLVFNGTEVWSRQTPDYGVQFESELRGLKPNGNVLANKMPTGNRYSAIPWIATTPWSAIIVPTNPPATADEWKAKLAQWAAEGNPLTVYYELAEPIVTDISAYFTEDNLIPVEGGGTITAVNENALAAPTTIVYQATGQSLADAFDEVHAYAQSILNGGSN